MVFGGAYMIWLLATNPMEFLYAMITGYLIAGIVIIPLAALSSLFWGIVSIVVWGAGYSFMEYQAKRGR